MARVAPEVFFSTESGHDDRARIRVGRKALSCFLLIPLTAGRITVNLLNPSSELYWDLPIPLRVFDGFFRPLLGALSFLPFLRYNGSWKPLHEVSLIGCIATLFTGVMMELTAISPVGRHRLLSVLILSCWTSRLGLVTVTNVKLGALGWRRTGWVCFWTWGGWLLARGIMTIMGSSEARYSFTFILLHVCQGLISAVNGFVLLYESQVKQRLLNKMIDEELTQTAYRGVWFLRLGAFLTVLDAVYLPLVETYGYSENKIHLSPALFLTFDNSVVLASILILGGLMESKDTLDQIEVMAELEHMVEHMARTQGKRIAFPGKLNHHSKHCIVSFPGKYSSET